MARFLTKLFLATILSIVALLGICVGIYKITDGLFTKESYQKGYVYQIRALERSEKNRPKVLILGGSYMTFAMDMPWFRSQMNMPAYTLGVHSGMGQAYTFEQARRFISKDDIVVFLFAGFSKNDYGMPLLYQTFDGEDDLLIDFFIRHPSCVLKSFCAECSHRILKVISEYTRNAIARKLTGRSFILTGVYCADAFDPCTGDLTYKRLCEYKRGQDIARYNLDVSLIDDSCFEVVNNLCRYCESHGAQMVVAFPPFVDESIILPKGVDLSVLDTYEEQLQARLVPKIIGKQKDAIFPVEMMHGCPMHLNSCGARCFTEKLVENLKYILRDSHH